MGENYSGKGHNVDEGGSEAETDGSPGLKRHHSKEIFRQIADYTKRPLRPVKFKQVLS
jgi:hypothetical protein